jgi:serine/threonine protein kinase
MSTRSTGSSEPNEQEILKMQRQCDLARDEKRIETIDTQDQTQCEHLLEAVLHSSSETRFHNIECLGLGAYGLVFAVDDRKYHGQRVAIKILRPSKATQRIPRERFEFEGQVLVELKHPNIIELLETGEFEGFAYHIVQWADAGSLANLFSSNRLSLSPEQSAWLVCKLAQALEEAHSLAVLHRDIKPGNILLQSCDPLESMGIGLWPLLTDFGLSKKMDHTPIEPLTDYGEVIGTLSYMSPEQVQGHLLRTPSDIFSLGVILSELVHGVHPFVDWSHFQTLTNIVQKAPQAPDRPDHPIPPSLQLIIGKCLQKESKERYRNARDLAEDLQRFLQGQPISLSPPTPGESAKRWIKSHPKTTVFLSTLIASLMGGVLLLSREWKVRSTLANGLAKANELFLNSMKVTNSNINDTVLAGKRVPASELLENITKQLPLLEEAHRLLPDDLKLTNHLQVMYHYQSLCFFSEASTNRGVNEQENLLQAISARNKSLTILQELIEKEPDELAHQVALINGLYNMSLLKIRTDGWTPPAFEWNSKAIEAGEKHLSEHPDDLDIRQTIFNLLQRRAMFLSKRSKTDGQVLDVYRSIADDSLELFKLHPDRTGFLVNYIEAVSSRSCLLWRIDRKEESSRVFQAIDKLSQDPIVESIEDWTVLERWLQHYFQRSLAYLETSSFAELVDLTSRWEEFLATPKVRNYPNAMDLREFNDRLVILMPKYMRGLAIGQLQPDSPEQAHAEQEARFALKSWLANPDADFDKLSASLKTVGIPLEPLQEWKAQVEASLH